MDNFVKQQPLLWFRQDLRTHDNPALSHFLTTIKPTRNMPAKALFFITKKQWQLHDWSEIKIDFILRHAHALVEELAQMNIMLSLVTVDDFSAQISYLQDYCQQHNIVQIFANSEVEYNEQQRDQAIRSLGINLTLFEADVIAPKGKILTKSATMFKVFTPFKKAWLHYVKENGFDYITKPLEAKQHVVQSPSTKNTATASSAWPLASIYEREILPRFVQAKLTLYPEQRDIPSIKATSGISAYLAAGVISPRYLLFLLLNKYPDLLTATDSNAFAWLNELIWREFYRHLIFHEQRLCKHQCFQHKYQHWHWPYNEQVFQAWCQGKTGYPLVDAAMKQLNQTGWMHNRLRMVVASFLTKHLLIDWRLGEKYFMQHLIDGDLAANNGGWQWAASTGCDAQPYFRIFNPIRQSERFDKNGDFIRKYLHELASIPNKHIHFPHEYIKQQGLTIYWPAIVDHQTARRKALEFYQQ